MKRLFLTLLGLLMSLVLYAGIRLSSDSGSSLILEYSLGSWDLASEGDYTRIIAEEMDYNSQPGAPLLPYDEFKVALPPEGDLRYTLLSSSTEKITLPSRLLPVPSVMQGEDVSEYIYQPDDALYNDSGTQFLLRQNVHNFRGLSLVPIRINPFAYDGQRELTIVKQAILRIDVLGNVNYKAAQSIDPVMKLMLAQVVNPVPAQNWISNTRSQINHSLFANSNWWVKIETNRDGIYKIDPAQLSGLPLADIDPREFRLFSTGGKVLQNTHEQNGAEFREVPIMVVGEADGTLDIGDAILFYGSSRDNYAQNSYVQSDPLAINPYSQNQIFWLTFGGDFSSEPLRMPLAASGGSYVASLTATPEQKQVESEVQRREDYGFTWYSERFFGNSTAEYELTTTLSDVQSGGSQSLSFRIRQEDIVSSVQHLINVQVNGLPVYSNEAEGNLNFSWYGNSFYTFNRPVTNLVNGLNTIRIKVLRSYTDNLFLDWFRLSYQQPLGKENSQKLFSHPQGNSSSYRFELSGNLGEVMVFRMNGIYQVERLNLIDNSFVSSGTGNTKYAMLSLAEAWTPASVQIVEPTDLLADNSQIDNIIISPSDFISQANLLASKYLDTYGVRSRVVALQDVFNQFNGGHPDPAAIRLMLKYFFQNLPQPRLSSVTLLGLGTIDWRNNSGSSAPKNKMIVWQGDYILSDDYFVMLNNNSYPELAIGRYPVKTTAELEIMLQNWTNYTANPTPGWWRNSIVVLGDDLNNGSSTNEYLHTQQTEEAANVVNPSILSDRIFALEYEYDEFQNKPRARDDMFKAINEGRLVWYYIGHGEYDKLGAEDYLNGATDMGRFNNHGKLPLFIASSCKVSHFDYWGFESLGQKLVMMNDLGAIASYSATRLSYPDNNHPMVKNLLDNLLNKRNPLGYSIMNAKIRYTESDSNDAVYVLLGDPVLRVLPPERDSSMTVHGQAETSILHSRDTASISGSFMADGLSGEASVRVFDTRKRYSLGPQTTVSHRGSQLFRGSAEVLGSEFTSGFVVPDDIRSGNSGLAVAYLWDEATKKDYSSYFYPVGYSDAALAVENLDAPQIQLYLGTPDFRPGDSVGTTTSLLATLSDANGINITGTAGHGILMVLDNALQPVSITDYFSYEKGSLTKGSLVYPLSNLSEGPHTIQLIAFDNFNLPSVATTHFVVKKSGELSLDRLLIYPNPMSKDGQITFMMSEAAELNIGIYSLRGKKIRSIKTIGKEGFNSIFWDGRDDQGSALANNTYFVKVKAMAPGGKTSELTEKVVIYK